MPSPQAIFLPIYSISAVISDLWPWFSLIWEWLPMFLQSYHRKKILSDCGRNIINHGHLGRMEFTPVYLFSTEITCYQPWFLEYKLSWANSALHGHPWWILYVLKHNPSPMKQVATCIMYVHNSLTVMKPVWRGGVTSWRFTDTSHKWSELMIHILQKSELLLNKKQWSHQIIILHMPWQLSCHGMYIIMSWPDQYLYWIVKATRFGLWACKMGFLDVMIQNRAIGAARCLLGRCAVTARLLHSPSLVATGLSVGYETWPPIGWHRAFMIG